MLELMYHLRRILDPAAAHRQDVLRAVAQAQEQAAIDQFARETQRIRAERRANEAQNNDALWNETSLDARR